VLGARNTLLGALALVLLGAPAAQARTYEVTGRTDPKPDACTASDCTLREAVIAANAHRGGDTIVLASRKRYELSLASTGEDKAANGDLDITSGPLTIVHRGRGTATIDANRTDRVFDIGRATTTLDKLTIIGGYSNKTDADGDGGGIVVGDLGDAPLTILRSRIIHNRAPWVGGNGGGIDSDSSRQVRLIDSDVSNNDSGGSGGGIEASPDGQLLIQGTTVSRNKAAQAGGVMVFGPPVRIVDSAVANNLASAGPDVEGDGGGIYIGNKGRLDLTNSTVANNGAYTSGGGIFSDAGGHAAVNFSTIARNRADADNKFGGTTGGVHLRTTGVAVPATARVANSIVVLNVETGGAGADCGGIGFLGTGINLISTTNQGTCSNVAPIVAANPLVGPLASNGGPTQTIALLAGSPAMGAAGAGRTPARDQRGVKRTDPDLGAYERR
jgi:parallel beta helix pectate lyase-like protein